MTPVITFYPLGNADTCRIDLADGRKVLIDYAAVLDPLDRSDRRCDLAHELKLDLAHARKSAFDVVCFSHLDEDHVKGAGDFFEFQYSASRKGAGRIAIDELWVPAAAVTEIGPVDDAWVIRQEARHRLKNGHGIKVFSRPECLAELLATWGLSVADRMSCIVDAGNYVPGFSKIDTGHTEFFVHSPFSWRRDDRGLEARNADSIAFQATFLEGGHETYALFGADLDHETLSQIVTTTRRHQRDDRLLWDVLKLFHHCSYTALGPDKGVHETVAVPNVHWLFEDQGRDGCIIVSPSKPIPLAGTPEDVDVQPPHRQAANHHRRVVSNKGGEFRVTMESPSRNLPKPFCVEIGSRGARPLLTVASPIAMLTSTPARAG